jgi:Tol biopolymer transport system component
MKKELFLLLSVFLWQITFAQEISVTSIRLLHGTEKGGYFYPVFSPKGTYLLTTGENYAGLNIHSLSANEMQKLTADAGAGYDLRISDDENTILFKRTELKNNLRYTSLQKYNMQEKKQLQVEKAAREKITPVFVGNQPAYVKGNALVKTSLKSSNDNDIAPFINIENQKIVLYSGTKRTILAPNGADASYFWASISPDKKRIVYCVASRGAYVADIDGKNAVSLGKLNAPKWLNNQWVIGMDDKDNGDFVVSSTIVAATIDGKIRQTLATPQTPIAMYPAASADGRQIAFNSGNGIIYILQIKLNTNIQK